MNGQQMKTDDQNPLVMSPNPMDILIGVRQLNRNEIANHLGNRCFNALVFANVQRYMDAMTKSEKSRIVDSVIFFLFERGVRFLRQRRKDRADGYIELTDFSAIRYKVAHTFRDSFYAPREAETKEVQRFVEEFIAEQPEGDRSILRKHRESERIEALKKSSSKREDSTSPSKRKISEEIVSSSPADEAVSPVPDKMYQRRLLLNNFYDKYPTNGFKRQKLSTTEAKSPKVVRPKSPPGMDRLRYQAAQLHHQLLQQKRQQNGLQQQFDRNQRLQEENTSTLRAMALVEAQRSLLEAESLAQQQQEKLEKARRASALAQADSSLLATTDVSMPSMRPHLASVAMGPLALRASLFPSMPRPPLTPSQPSLVERAVMAGRPMMAQVGQNDPALDAARVAAELFAAARSGGGSDAFPFKVTRPNLPWM